MELPSKLPCRQKKGMSGKIVAVLKNKDTIYESTAKTQFTNPQLIATPMPHVQVLRGAEWHDALLEPRSHIQEKHREKRNSIT